MKSLIIIAFLLSFNSFASSPTDIKTNFGILKNVQIVDSTEDYYVVKTTEGNRKVFKDTIIKIYYAPFDSTVKSSLILDEVKDADINYETDPQYERPNTPLIVVSLALFYLSYDYFDRGSKIGNNLGDEAESEKTKLVVGGAIFLVAGIVNTIFALKSVRIYGNKNSVGLSYNF